MWREMLKTRNERRKTISGVIRVLTKVIRKTFVSGEL
jgi:hypothetical protein